MNSENSQKTKFTRRAMLLGGCKTALVAGLLGRMFYLQVLNHKELLKLSEKNHIKTIFVRPARGRILDRNNNELANNRQSYQLNFEKIEEEQDFIKISNLISTILGYAEEDKEELIETLSELKNNEEVVIAQNISYAQIMELELNLYQLKGLNIEVSYERFYPHAEKFSHIIGYLGSVSDKKSSKQLPFLKIGKNGVEKTQEKILQGEAGSKKIEVNAKGEIIKQLAFNPSVPGEDLKLSVDLELQEKGLKLLGDSSGVILLAKLDTGEILTSISNPSFDPNIFSQKIPQEKWNSLLKNPEQPLINRIVALTYPPGSVFKINVAIAALKNNFDPETKFSCPGHYVLGERKFRCWNKQGHGNINLFQAIAGSCNVYFWNVAKQIGIQKFADNAKDMGFSQKILDNFLPREQSGIIPDPQWKKEHVSANWSMADTFNSAIGQGYVEATPIQILTMIMRIASGKSILPSFNYSDAIVTPPSLNLEKELAIVKKGMTMTTNWESGTGYLNRITIPGFEMAGKTGTCQVISKRHADDDLSSANVVKKYRNHGVFVAYAPLENPKYAYCGIIEHGGTPALAVKIAKELLTEAQLKKI